MGGMTTEETTETNERGNATGKLNMNRLKQYYKKQRENKILRQATAIILQRMERIDDSVAEMPLPDGGVIQLRYRPKAV